MQQERTPNTALSGTSILYALETLSKSNVSYGQWRTLLDCITLILLHDSLILVAHPDNIDHDAIDRFVDYTGFSDITVIDEKVLNSNIAHLSRAMTEKLFRPGFYVSPRMILQNPTPGRLTDDQNDDIRRYYVSAIKKSSNIIEWNHKEFTSLLARDYNAHHKNEGRLSAILHQFRGVLSTVLATKYQATPLLGGARTPIDHAIRSEFGFLGGTLGYRFYLVLESAIRSASRGIGIGSEGWRYVPSLPATVLHSMTVSGEYGETLTNYRNRLANYRSRTAKIQQELTSSHTSRKERIKQASLLAEAMIPHLRSLEEDLNSPMGFFGNLWKATVDGFGLQIETSDGISASLSSAALRAAYGAALDWSRVRRLDFTSDLYDAMEEFNSAPGGVEAILERWQINESDLHFAESAETVEDLLLQKLVSSAPQFALLAQSSALGVDG